MAVLAMIYYNHRTELSSLITPKPVQQKSFSEPMIEQSQLSLSDWSSDQPIQRNKEMAYQSLLKQWDIIYNPDNGSACQQAQAQGIGCLKAQGSLSSLIHLNRPAVLKLFDDQGREFYALLTALRGQTAIFVVGTETWTSDIKEIEKRWLGDYTMLWQMPPDYKGPIHPGQRGMVVQWLDRQLSLIQGRSTQPRTSLIFDETLVRQVKKFQLAKGLVPDGIIGPQTIIHLNTEVGSREPVLVDKQEDK
jgi:general secretion pathway protein A